MKCLKRLAACARGSTLACSMGLVALSSCDEKLVQVQPPLKSEPAPVEGDARPAGEAPETSRPKPPSSAANVAASPAWTPDWSGDLLNEAAKRGLDYHNRSGTAAKDTVLEANGAGVALLDLGNDGDLDVVFSQGLDQLSAVLHGAGADLELFANDGAGNFQRQPGPGLAGWWTGLAAGDVDNDGDCDLVAAGYGDLVLLLQDEHGKLVRGPAFPLAENERLVCGAKREKGRPPLWLTSLALFDADKDGNLDLYACAYLELDPVAPPLGALGEDALAVPCRWKSYPVFCGPSGMRAQLDRVFEGDGAGNFVDRSKAWLPNQRASFGLGVAAFDADGDGDTDLYVANDSTPNFLWINDGRGTFQDVAMTAGVALSKDGMAEAGMGVAVADVDRDGRLDFAVTNFSGEPTQLYLGAKVGFRSLTHQIGLLRETRELLSWGVHLTDFDGDGWCELFTANGHVYPQADLEGTGTSYHQEASLWRLADPSGAWKLARVRSSNADSLLAQRFGARGSALGDLDGDGRSDLALARIDAAAALGMNRLGPAAGRFALRCLGPRHGESPSGTAAEGRTPADGMGTRVALVPELAPGVSEFALLREVQTSGSFQSSNSPWLEFGLGPAQSVRELRVDWPSGRSQTLGPFPAGVRVTVQEGRGVIATEDLR